MSYQVDQSNKFERSGDTALALSNDVQYTIRIPGREKRKAIEELSRRRKRRRDKWIVFQLFAVALYYLIRALPPGEQVMIDVEYTGHDSDIRNMLFPLLRRDVPGFNVESVSFGYVGKKSPAHKKALAMYQRKIKPDRILKADDLLRQITG